MYLKRWPFDRGVSRNQTDDLASDLQLQGLIKVEHKASPGRRR